MITSRIGMIDDYENGPLSSANTMGRLVRRTVTGQGDADDLIQTAATEDFQPWVSDPIYIAVGGIASIVGSAGTVTVTLNAGYYNTLSVGQTVAIAGVITTTGYNGTWTVATSNPGNAGNFTFASATTGTAGVSAATLSAYVATDCVTDSGLAYVCISGTSGSTHPAADSKHWKICTTDATPILSSTVRNQQALLPVLQTAMFDTYGRPVAGALAIGDDVEVLVGHGPDWILGRRALWGSGASTQAGAAQHSNVEDVVAGAGIIKADYGQYDYADEQGVTWTAPLARDPTRSIPMLSVDPAWIASGGALPDPIPLANLSGITTAQLSATAGIVAGQIASVNPSALTGSGTVPLAGLSGITTTQLSATAGITSGQIAAVASSTLTGAIPSGWLGLTATQAMPGNTTIPGAYTLPDAATGTIGGVEIDAAPISGHPIALTQAGTGVPNSYIGSGANQVVAGNDSRLTNARTPTVHEGSHLPGGSDTIDWVGTIHAKGTHAARPAAASGNAGTFYFETDTTNLFRSDGSVWLQVASTTGAYTLPDALTSAIGGVKIDHAPGSGDPIAVTQYSLGIASGVATLDSSTHVPIAQLGLTTAGDLLSVAAGVVSRLGAAAQGAILSTNATPAPAWVAAGTTSQVLVGGTSPGFGNTPYASLPVGTTSTTVVQGARGSDAILTTTGDLMIASAANTGNRLAAAAQGAILKTDSTPKPAWIAAGTASQVLVGGTSPAFGNVPYAALPVGTTSTTVVQGSRGADAILATTGDLLVASAANTGNRLGAAAQGAILSTNSTPAPAWIAAGTTSQVLIGGTSPAFRAVPLAALSGITTSQLSATAGITSGQIASVASSTLTGAIPAGWLGTTSTTALVGNTDVLLKSTVTAAGDLIVGTANDAVARLGIGTAGQILSVSSPPIFTSGCVAFYNLDDASGSSTIDATGNGNTGTWYGTLGSQWGTGKINGCGVFDGSTNYVNVGSGSDLSIYGDMSIWAWVKTTAASGVIFDRYKNGSPYNGYGLEYGSSSIPSGEICIFNGAAWAKGSSSAPINDGSWHLVVVSIIGSTATFYVDNVSQGTATITWAGGAYSGNGFIGYDQTGHYAHGSIDGLGISNRGLTSTDVATIWNGGAGIEPLFTSGVAWTSNIHLPAGVATAGGSPLKLTPGTLLTTPELGAIEFVDNGTTGHLYITQNVAGVLTRVQIA